MEPCLYVVRTPSGEHRFPAGCRATRYTAVLVKEPGFTWRRSDGFCVVEGRGPYVLPERVCGILDDASRASRVAAVFLGPPGTGKSVAMRLVADVWPGRVREVEAESLLGGIVGETEKRLTEVLDDCEHSRPCLLVVDEADYLISERGRGYGSGDGYSRISENVVRILLRRLQRWAERGGPSIVMTTNKPITQLDSALVRGMRLEPVVFPPPSPDAIVLLGTLMGREVDRSEAVRAAAAAPTFPNIVEWLRGGSLRRFRVSSGIAIIGVDRDVPRSRGEDPGSLVVAEDYPVSIALGAVVAQSVTGKPLVVALDAERLEEAAWLAESMDAYLGVVETPVQETVLPRLLQFQVRKMLLGSRWRAALPRLTLDRAETVVPGLRRVLGCSFLDARCLLRAVGLR